MTYCKKRSAGPCQCQPEDEVFCVFDSGVAEAQKLQDAIDQALADYARGKDIHEIMKELKAARVGGSEAAE